MGRGGYKRLIILIFCFFTYCSFSQVNITGQITSNNKPIPSVNITLNDSLSRIIAYTFSDQKGTFNLSTEKSGNFIIKFSSLGYKSQSIPIIIEKFDKNKPLEIVLEEEAFTLEEVIIKSELPIIVKNDTIKFKTMFFVKGNEQTVEDLLKVIPGLNIDSEGTIKVGNQEIEKLMVDGDDLFEKGYKVLSKNMPAYPIEEVEVLKNYSNNRLLKGIEDSNKVALNLKLNEKSKRIWFGNVEASFGNNSFYQYKGNLMNFGKKNKYYFLTNINSIGYDATGDIKQLIKPFRFNEPSSIGDNQQVNNLINLSISDFNFKKDRTNFNNAELASLNAIFNPSKKLKIKTLGFFNWDETNFFRNRNDIVNLNNINFTNTEDYSVSNKQQLAFGKLDFIYNFSKTKMLEATTKYNNGNFNDSSNLIFNANSTIENLKHRNTFFDQKINYTNKFENKKVLLLTGRFINEKSPQNYSINQFFYQDLFPEFSNANNVKQLSNNQMQFIGFNAHLLDKKHNNNLLEIQLGDAFRKDKLNSMLSLLENQNLLNNPIAYKNKTIYSVNDLYLRTKYSYKIKDLAIIGKLDMHQLFNKLESHLTLNQNPFFINPSIGLDWKINEKNKIKSSYSYNTSNARILDVYDNFVLNSFRSFTKGLGTFNQLEASNIFFNYQLGNWADRFFANTTVLYTKNHDFLSTNSIINQNFVQSEKIVIKDRTFFNINSKLDYYFKFMSSNLKLDLGYSKSQFKNIVNNSNLREITSKNYNYGLELRSAFKGIFNYHIGTKWSVNSIQTITDNSFTNNQSFLDLNFVFNEKFDLLVKSERYHFGNLEDDNNYYFLDFDMRYNLIENKLTLGVSGKNLINTKRFRSFSINDLGSSTTEIRLLPRIVLLKAEYRF